MLGRGRLTKQEVKQYRDDVGGEKMTAREKRGRMGKKIKDNTQVKHSGWATAASVIKHTQKSNSTCKREKQETDTQTYHLVVSLTLLA